MVVDKQEFINQVSALFKGMGQGPTSGLIIGELMVASKPNLSLDELSERVGRAKSTTHTATQNLIKLGIVEHWNMPIKESSEGRYPSYYRINQRFWKTQLQQVENIRAFKRILGQALDILRNTENVENKQQKQRIETLEKLYALYAFFEDKLPKLLETWDDKLKSGEYREYLDK